MKKDKNTKQIEKTQISGNVVKKAILPTFCFAALSTMAFDETIYAKQTTTTEYVNVTSGTLNLRKAASSNAAIIASLSKGTAVTVYSQANGWAKVTANEKEGYVNSNFLSSNNPNQTSTAAKAVPTTKYVNVSSGSLNMRNSASISASIIVKLATGTAVTVYSESAGWAKIEAYGKTGYVSTAYLSAENPSQGKTSSSKTKQPVIKYVNISSTSKLNVRKNPSTNSAIVATLTNGTEVEVSTENSSWAKIQANGIEGYVSSAFLSSAKSNTNSSSAAKPKTTTKYVNVNIGSTLNMRKSASENASIVVKLARGVEVNVDSETNGWAKVEVYGQTGYVNSNYLSVTKPDTETNHSQEPSPGQSNQTKAEKYVNVIYGSSLNMRSAGTSNAAIIAKLARGTVVTVLSEANGWAKVTANGQTGYVSSQYLSATPPLSPNTSKNSIEKITQTYNISLKDMVKLEIPTNPQTDKKYNTYIRSDALTLTSSSSGIVNGNGWSIRGGAGLNYWIVGKVNNQEPLKILAKVKGTDGHDWYQVSYNKQWVNASPDDISYYVNPDNFLNNTVDSLQFLKLSISTNLNTDEVNERILKGKGILQGMASTFIKASNTYGINELYLISHALLETNNGKSELANGVKINGRTVYNMYGIGAYDQRAVASGAQFAYNAGWFTPEAAIIGGAKFIADGYINAGQDTLYKMRWNPSAAALLGTATHQYASDIGWAAKQVQQIYNLYKLLDSYKLVLEIPKYK